MKNLFFILIAYVGLTLLSCSSFKDNMSNVPVTDLVCGMKVTKSESFTYKYNSKVYYFDTYNCKQTFKMDPEKFVNNSCVDTSKVKMPGMKH